MLFSTFGAAVRSFYLICALACIQIVAPTTAVAQTNPFDGGWVLQNQGSALNFQSVKNGSVIEISRFATFTGEIQPDGSATVQVMLESVDTNVDLRNVRMRFLLFESFKFPQATITTQIDAALVSDLAKTRRQQIRLPYTLALHGIEKADEADVVVTLLTDNLVSVATAQPISVSTADFDLTDGVEKLQDAAGVTILPVATVTFDFLFERQSAVTQAPETPAAAPAKVALEAEGTFDEEACIGRFDILSRSGNIYFRPGSSALDPSSGALLNQLFDVVSRCPGMKIEVSGHTDSDGSSASNQRLSEARAGSVTTYLVDKGIDGARIVTVGFGEARPVAPNDTPKNKSRNRRIEFAVVE